MRPRGYYNEIDSYCADWLENLIRAGLIAPGDVDRRDIRDVRPDDLRGYTQAHMFAGIGVWSLALREAGWPDDRPVWTGSCPCQPFSAAGKGGGFADERHLWPEFFRLIDQCHPSTVIGEQVASPDGLRWLDLVQDDLEGAGYAFGAVDLCAAGAGVAFAESEEGRQTIEWIRGAVLSCPDPFLAAELRDFAAWAGANLGVGPAHIRQRLFWLACGATRPVAHAERERRERWGPGEAGRRRALSATERSCDARPVADALFAGRPEGRSVAGNGSAPGSGAIGELGNARGEGSGRDAGTIPGARREGESKRGQPRRVVDEPFAASSGRDWIVCTDGRARPTQSGLQPLAHGASARVGRLRAYGNAIQKDIAVEFIRAADEAMRAS